MCPQHVCGTHCPQHTPEDRFCVNCIHIATVGSGDWTKFRCMAPENKNGTNLVTGKQKYKYEFCEEARVSPKIAALSGKFIKMEDLCGPTGKWFVKKEPTQERPPEATSASTTDFNPQDLDSLANAAAAKLAAIKNKKKGLSATDLENL